MIQSKLVVTRVGHSLEVTMKIGADSMFGKFDLMEILRTQLAISKYTNWQLTDDTPYSHVELMNKVVDEMAKKEQENIDKAMQKY